MAAGKHVSEHNFWANEHGTPESFRSHNATAHMLCCPLEAYEKFYT